MKKIALALYLATTFCLANEMTQDAEKTFTSDLAKEVQSVLDANISDKIKMENIKEYLTTLEFNDEIDDQKYPFTLRGHHENYMLLGGYSSTKLYEKEWSDAHHVANKYERDTNEAQFQISIKVPLYANFLHSGGDLFTAYTQNSYWQVYNTERSSPFRETNYMPELFMEWQPEKKFGDSKLLWTRLALIHQSNGQDVGQSRSWNRTEFSFVFQKDAIYYGASIWDRWNEDAKLDANATEGDDNPDLEKFIGNQKYFVKYRGDTIDLSLAYQNDILEYNRHYGNLKLDLSFPSVNKNLDFFVRYFYGYGESLVDYNEKIKRISFGILISDWI